MRENCTCRMSQPYCYRDNAFFELYLYIIQFEHGHWKTNRTKIMPRLLFVRCREQDEVVCELRSLTIQEHTTVWLDKVESPSDLPLGMAFTNTLNHLPIRHDCYVCVFSSSIIISVGQLLFLLVLLLLHFIQLVQHSRTHTIRRAQEPRHFDCKNSSSKIIDIDEVPMT